MLMLSNEANLGRASTMRGGKSSQKQMGSQATLQVIILTKFGSNSEIPILPLNSSVTPDVSRVKTVGCLKTSISLRRLSSRNSGSACSHSDFLFPREVL